MAEVAGDQAAGVCGQRDFEKGFVRGVVEAGGKRYGSHGMTVCADCFEQRGNARGVEGKVWPEKHVAVLGKYARVVVKLDCAGGDGSNDLCGWAEG